MLLYECFYIAVRGTLIQFLKTLKKFNLDAELQPLRASPKMSFPQTYHFLEAGQGGGWGCGYEKLAAGHGTTRSFLQWMYRHGEAHTAFDRVL